VPVEKEKKKKKKKSKKNAGNTRDRDHLEDLGIEGIIILKCIFKKWDEDVWTGSI
jgi:hypothetical protein